MSAGGRIAEHLSVGVLGADTRYPRKDGIADTLKTSTLTLGEILVRPMRVGRGTVVIAYRKAFERMPSSLSFGVAEAVAFAFLRAERPSFRAPDAVQLSCAAIAECDLFFTNDDRLSELEVKGIGRIVNLPTWSEVLFE